MWFALFLVQKTVHYLSLQLNYSINIATDPYSCFECVRHIIALNIELYIWLFILNTIIREKTLDLSLFFMSSRNECGNISE